MKKVLRTLGFILAVGTVPFLSRWAVCGFRPAKLAFDLPFNSSWKTMEITPEIQKIFAQPFSYLSHGGQSFVFVSEDGQYTLKLFRCFTRPHPWRRALRKWVFTKQKLEPKEKGERLFTAATLAYEKAKDLTGLVALHLNPSGCALPTVRLIDRIGRVYQVDLNRHYFALQIKGIPIRSAFKAAVQEKDRDRFLHLSRQFVLLLKERTDRLLSNSDTKVSPNFGFLSEQAIEWDFGNYYIDPKLNDPVYRKQQAQIFIDHLQVYLNHIAPDWADEAKEIFRETLL